MKFYKKRNKGKLQLGLLSLDGRMKLSTNHKNDLEIIEKGYEGEVYYDGQIEDELTCDALVMCDLLLKFNTVFQIDTITITSSTLYLYEIKHFKSRYKYENDMFLTLNNVERLNPILQLNKLESLIRQMLQYWNIQIKVEAKLVFTHPEFYLYKDEPNNTIIYYTHIKEHLKSVNRNKKSLNKTHYTLAQKLMDLLQEEVPYQKKLPEYSYEELRKGIRCTTCRSFDLNIKERTTVCKTCQKRTPTDQVVLGAITEYKLLFPDEKVTTSKIYDWCNKEVYILKIRKILKDNYKKIGITNGVHYT